MMHEPTAGPNPWSALRPPTAPPPMPPAAPPPMPPTLSATTPPAPPVPTPARSGGPRGGGLRLVAVALVAAVAGGGSGAVVARLVDDDSSPDVTSAVGVAVADTTTSTTDLDIATPIQGLIDVPAIAETLEPSVVSIEVSATVQGRSGRSTTSQGAGTGFVLTSDGQIATNAHVVSGATTITVVLSDGTRLAATVVGIDTSEDLAVLQVQAGGLTPVTIGSSGSLRVGESVVAMGNALALEGGLTVSMGIVSALDRSLSVETTTYSDLIQTDAAISSGNSGGPLVDADGKVIGINSAAAASTSAENIGFAIAIDHALPILRTLGARV